MDTASLAQVQEETTLTKIRVNLNSKNVKLWEPPYLEPETKLPVEQKLHELAVELQTDITLPLGYIIEGLKMLQKHALEKLSARDKFRQTGMASLRVRCARGLQCRARNIEMKLDHLGRELLEELGRVTGVSIDNLRVICGGRVISEEISLQQQGVKNGGTVMVVLVGNNESLRIVAEQRRILDQTKTDAARLGGKNCDSDHHSLQVADQSGKSIDLPPAEKKTLVIAMSLHEKGRAALKKKDYSLALVLLLEADREFKTCRSDILKLVDNYAILNLDITWCYLSLQTVSELSDAEFRLQSCEENFNDSYGKNLERLAALKGTTGNETALLMRLHLLQGIVHFHLGRTSEAKLLLEKAHLEHNYLLVDENSLLQIASMGYSIAEARLGLRATQGDVKMAVEHILKRREEKELVRKKEQEENERNKLMDKLGQCADGSWVNVGYYKTLVGMGFSGKVARTALKQANNSLNLAVQLLQEEPDLIQMATEEQPNKKKKNVEVTDEMVAAVVAVGFESDMAKLALEMEGSVAKAVEALMASGGVIKQAEDKEDAIAEDQGKRRKIEQEEDRNAYHRITEGLSTFEEDHLDLDLQEEYAFLQKYLELVKSGVS